MIRALLALVSVDFYRLNKKYTHRDLNCLELSSVVVAVLILLSRVIMEGRMSLI